MPVEPSELPSKKQINKTTEGFFDRVIRQNKNNLLIDKDEGNIKKDK